MWAEVGQIVLWVVLAGVAGLVAGWVLRSLGRGERRGDVERRLTRARDEMSAAREEARRAVERVSGLEDEIAGLRGRAEMQASLLAQRDQRIADLLADLDELALEAERRGPERTLVAPPPPPPSPPPPVERTPEPEPEPAPAEPEPHEPPAEPAPGPVDEEPVAEPAAEPTPAGAAAPEPAGEPAPEPIRAPEPAEPGPEAPRPIREPALQQPTLPGVLGPASAAAAAAAERRQASRRRGEPIVPLEDEDDLTVIKGIGPVLEAKLKQLGVRTYRQIAGWSQRDVEDVSKALGSFPQRIERDGWIASAREQHRRKYGVHP